MCSASGLAFLNRATRYYSPYPIPAREGKDIAPDDPGRVVVKTEDGLNRIEEPFILWICHQCFKYMSHEAFQDHIVRPALCSGDSFLYLCRKYVRIRRHQAGRSTRMVEYPCTRSTATRTRLARI